VTAVLRTQLRGMTRRPSRLLLTGLAVLVVSFVVYATVLAQRIAENTLLASLSGTPVAADLVVRDGDAAPGRLTTGQLAAIAKLPGVAEAVGRAAADGQVGTSYLQISADPGSGPLAVTHLREGRMPAKRGEIAVTPRTADLSGLKVGDTVRMVTAIEDGKPANPATITVVGVVENGDDYGYQGYAPLSTVTALSGRKQLDRMEVRLAAGADREAVRQRIAAVVASAKVPVELGADVRHEEARERASDVDDVFAVIAMFVAIAVVAAGLVGASTFRIVFAQRMRQLALLRAIGAGRRGIRWSLAVEGALTGLVTGLAGVLLALGAGHLLPVVLRVFGTHISAPGVPLLAAAGTVALAVTITTVAVLAPAFSAARVAPLEALRSSGTTGSRRDIGKARWAFGLLLVVAAGLVAAYVARNLPGRDPRDYNPLPMLLGVVASGGLAFLALIALGPVVVRPVLAVLGAPLRHGPVGRLAAGGVGSAPRRAAAVSVVVALGVALISGVLVGGASIRMLADREIASSSPADFELTPVADSRITTAMVQEMRARPALSHIAPYRRLDVKVGDQELDVNDLSLRALPALGKLDTAAGSAADVGPGRIMLSAYAVEATGRHIGDQMTITKGKLSVSLTVAAEMPDQAPLHSSIIMDPSDLDRLGAPATFSGVLADAATTGEKARTDGRAALTAVGSAHGALWNVEVLADQRDSTNDQLTIVLGIALGLIGLTVLIAVVGVGTTTALSVVERVREAGLLRAVGLSRGGLRTMLTTESALYGVIGSALGLALGVPYAWLAVQALGVNAPLALPAGQLALVFLILVLLTAAAGVLPARRAAKVSPVTALGSE